MKSIKWNVKIKNPLTAEILDSKDFNKVDDITDVYPFLTKEKWRNICLGRSKVYSVVVEVNKIVVS